ncbi:hypothetical protein DIPPA_55150 [Diplonema papillatum]|nr:hypothetical protein DIPPA_55150 [Diplonema papillatum]
MSSDPQLAANATDVGTDGMLLPGWSRFVVVVLVLVCGLLLVLALAWGKKLGGASRPPSRQSEYGFDQQEAVYIAMNGSYGSANAANAACMPADSQPGLLIAKKVSVVSPRTLNGSADT